MPDYTGCFEHLPQDLDLGPAAGGPGRNVAQFFDGPQGAGGGGGGGGGGHAAAPGPNPFDGMAQPQPDGPPPNPFALFFGSMLPNWQNVAVPAAQGADQPADPEFEDIDE